MAEIDREMGELSARVDALGDAMKESNRQLAEQGKTLKAIQLELASAKGAGRAVVGIAVMFGGALTLIAQKVLGKLF